MENSPVFEDVLAGMQATFTNIKDYQCLYHLYSTDGKKVRDLTFKYYFKKPKQIRMDVCNGKYLGAVLIYNPLKQEKQVRIRLCNPALSFMQKLMRKEYLDLNNEWVTDARGVGVHESDVGWLILEHQRLLHMGKSHFMGRRTVGGRNTLHFRLISDFPEKTISVKQEDIWVDSRTYFPIKYVQSDVAGMVIRQALYEDIRFDNGLKNDLFSGEDCP